MIGLPGKVEESNTDQIIAMNWAFCMVALFFLLVKIYARLRTQGWRGLWWDDFLLFLTLVFGTIQACLTHWGCQLGFGNHVKDIPLMNLLEIQKIFLIVITFNALASITAKIAFAAALWKIGRAVPWMGKVLSFSFVTTVLFKGGMLFIPWIRCRPTRKMWEPWMDGTCQTKDLEVAYATFSSIWGGILDIVLSMLPWKVIPILQITRREKISVMIAIGMGFVAGITSFLKAAFMHTLHDKDFSYTGFWLMFWAIAEPNISIISISIPMCRVLVKDIMSVAANSKMQLKRTKTLVVAVGKDRGGYDDIDTDKDGKGGRGSEGGGGGGGATSVGDGAESPGIDGPPPEIGDVEDGKKDGSRVNVAKVKEERDCAGGVSITEGGDDDDEVGKIAERRKLVMDESDWTSTTIGGGGVQMENLTPASTSGMKEGKVTVKELV